MASSHAASEWDPKPALWPLKSLCFSQKECEHLGPICHQLMACRLRKVSATVSSPEKWAALFSWDYWKGETANICIKCLACCLAPRSRHISTLPCCFLRYCTAYSWKKSGLEKKVMWLGRDLQLGAEEHVSVVFSSPHTVHFLPG